MKNCTFITGPFLCFCKRGILLFGLGFCAQSLCYGQAYTNPVHLIQEIGYNQVMKRFDKLSQTIKRRAVINDSIHASLIMLRDMKEEKISSMSAVPEYYTDPVRLDRFKKKIETTRSIIDYCRKRLKEREKYVYFKDAFEKLENELGIVEANWEIVTEFKGKRRLMDAHQRYKLALYVEQGLNDISRDAINYSCIAYALTRSSEEAAEENKEIMNGILQSHKGIE